MKWKFYILIMWKTKQGLKNILNESKQNPKTPHHERKVINIERVLLYLSRYIHREIEGFVFNFVFSTWF